MQTPYQPVRLKLTSFEYCTLRNVVLAATVGKVTRPTLLYFLMIELARKPYIAYQKQPRQEGGKIPVTLSPSHFTALILLTDGSHNSEIRLLNLTLAAANPF